MSLKEIFNDIEKHLLEDDKPSEYLNILKDEGKLNEAPFHWIKDLEKIDQSPKHHPEGNVWIHTMMVVDNGATYREKVENERAFMWALLLHDIGKRSTTKVRKGRLTSYDHDKVGKNDCTEFLECFHLDEEFIDSVVTLVRYHMHLLFITNRLPYGDIEGMKRESNLHDLAYVFLSDRLGRGGLKKDDIDKVIKDVNSFRKNFL